jgi:hypothetical protein
MKADDIEDNNVKSSELIRKQVRKLQKKPALKWLPEEKC